jgi:hypothetical protein
MITAILFAAISQVSAMAQDKTVLSFDRPEDLAIVKSNGVHVSRKGQALDVEFMPGEWSNVAFEPAAPWDWSDYDGLALDVTNPGAERVEFGLRVDDDLAADGVKHCRSANGAIAAGKTATFLLPLGAADPMSFGMRVCRNRPAWWAWADGGRFRPITSSGSRCSFTGRRSRRGSCWAISG